MYYRVYGILNTTGFNVELAQTASLSTALDRIQDLEPKTYPLFAITEHKQKGSPAYSIYAGYTKDRKPFNARLLVSFLPNPVQDPKAGAEYFGNFISNLDEVIS